MEVIPDKAPELIIRPLIVLTEVGPTKAPPLVIDAEPVVAIVPEVEMLIFEARSAPVIKELERTPKLLV